MIEDVVVRLDRDVATDIIGGATVTYRLSRAKTIDEKPYIAVHMSMTIKPWALGRKVVADGIVNYLKRANDYLAKEGLMIEGAYNTGGLFGDEKVDEIRMVEMPLWIIPLRKR